MLVIAGARLRPVDGRIAWVSPAEAPDGLRVLLGERDGVQHFAVIVDPSEAPGDRDEWVVLRAIVQSLADEDVADAPLVLHAIGLAEWLWSTRHCPRCGGRWSRVRRDTCCTAPAAARTSSRAPTRP